MSCGQAWDGTAIGLSITDSYVEVGVDKFASDGQRHPYGDSRDYRGIYGGYVNTNMNFNAADYYAYEVIPYSDPSFPNFIAQIYYNGTWNDYIDNILDGTPAHASFAGMEGSSSACLDGYASFQGNEFEPNGGNWTPWCPTVVEKNINIPDSGCILSNGEQWNLGN